MQSADNISYQFIVSQDALTGSEQEMFEQLERYTLASVLSDLEGMCVNVTTNGCVIG